MKYYKYVVDGKTLLIKLDESKKSITEITFDGIAPVPSQEEMPFYIAAISLALLENHVEIVHDDEPGIITINNNQNTLWGTPEPRMIPPIGIGTCTTSNTTLSEILS